jgi:hypothetical protein
MPEETTEINQSGATGLMGNIFSISGIMMLFFAAFIDLGEALFELIPGPGTIISAMLDVVALIFIGLFWMRLFRGYGITATKKTGSTIKSISKTGKKYKWLKPFCMIFEMIPVVSSIAPLWVLAVLLELSSREN